MYNGVLVGSAPERCNVKIAYKPGNFKYNELEKYILKSKRETLNRLNELRKENLKYVRHEVIDNEIKDINDFLNEYQHNVDKIEYKKTDHALYTQGTTYLLNLVQNEFEKLNHASCVVENEWYFHICNHPTLSNRQKCTDLRSLTRHFKKELTAKDEQPSNYSLFVYEQIRELLKEILKLDEINLIDIIMNYALITPDTCVKMNNAIVDEIQELHNSSK